MKKQHRLMLLPLVIAFALLAVFVLTAPVQAQDEVPPPEAAPTEVISEAAPVPEVVPTDAPPEVIPSEIRQAETPDPEVLQTDAVQLEETLIEGSVEAPVVDPTAQDLAPALDAVADAGLVLADESGEPLTLVSEDTVQTLIGADPYYTTAAGKYMFILSPGSCPDPLPSGTVYCTVSTTPIQAAINYIPTSGLPSNGLIYVEAGAYSELPTINALGNPIYNGLKGLIGTVSDGVPQVNLAGDIFVNNVDLGFTIKGFNITATANLPFAGIYIIDSIGPVKIEDVAITNTGTGRGISIVNHNGSVTLTRVKSSGNTQNDGASIDNTAGSSGVTIGNSAFDDNFLDGLKIKTKGKVTIIGISASGNKGGDGVLISSLGGLDIRSSVFSDNTAEIGTDASGLKAYDNMKGNITLVDVLANNNEQHGIYL
ncbi:MAG: hypothetical protein HGA28_06675, partial [Anaerolineaceae bacterium]|nr:hypothetical protein [Anaerolineaceae bacterium]